MAAAEGGADTASAAAALAPSSGLMLYLLIEPHCEKVAVELPADATVKDLRAAAYEAGGPAPCRQLLAVGTTQLTDPSSTPLSDTGLIASEVVVTVAARTIPTVLDCNAMRVVVLLEGGAVVGYCPKSMEMAVASSATHVAAGQDVRAAVVAGELRVWGKVTRTVLKDLPQLRDKQVVMCAASDVSCEICAVDAEGVLYLCGDKGRYGSVPAELQGNVAAAALCWERVVVLTRDGAVLTFGSGRPPSKEDLGGGRAVSISASCDHYAAVLDDGTVRCFGKNTDGECDVPAGLCDVVSCKCGKGGCVAVRADGTLCWWGIGCTGLDDGPLGSAGPYVAAATSGGLTYAVTTAGTLVSDCAASVLSRYAAATAARLQKHFRRIPNLGGRIAVTSERSD
eukprot:TRINITY_DN537_c0_g1_i2.p1 TRINITY_DN537_c0_g1~~TRINITY_DN537_c0_g1_i2.p1  ORF type:complete len:396 (+),score=118.45 TRINITY_DN537_c0_g1_i2:71-1258(+)